jgi:hypothetical protein
LIRLLISCGPWAESLHLHTGCAALKAAIFRKANAIGLRRRGVTDKGQGSPLWRAETRADVRLPKAAKSDGPSAWPVEKPLAFETAAQFYHAKPAAGETRLQPLP